MEWIKECPTSRAAAIEEAGLRWLAAAPDGPAVVRVRERAGRRLVLDRIETTAPGAGAARMFGAALARMHAAGAPTWGALPPGGGVDSREATIGQATLATPRTPPPSWGEFYARHRLRPHLEHARRAGRIPERGASAVGEVIGALERGELDHPQPGLVGTGPARLHGDLWQGNVLWREAGAVLIDPAAHGGHAETDLAMLALFGAPHLEPIREAYDEVSPLAPGWRARVALHQLHPLLVHAELFGGGYGEQAAEAARRVIGGG